jgi:hypothetical protein
MINLFRQYFIDILLQAGIIIFLLQYYEKCKEVGPFRTCNEDPRVIGVFMIILALHLAVRKYLDNKKTF